MGQTETINVECKLLLLEILMQSDLSQKKQTVVKLLVVLLCSVATMLPFITLAATGSYSNLHLYTLLSHIMFVIPFFNLYFTNLLVFTAMGVMAYRKMKSL